MHSGWNPLFKKKKIDFIINESKSSMSVKRKSLLDICFIDKEKNII